MSVRFNMDAKQDSCGTGRSSATVLLRTHKKAPNLSLFLFCFFSRAKYFRTLLGGVRGWADSPGANV